MKRRNLTNVFSDSLVESDCRGNVITAPSERLLVGKRQHWMVMFGPVMSLLLVGITTTVIAFFVFSYALGLQELFVISTLMVVLLVINLAAKNIIDWYLHIYIVTTNKILEVRYSPLSSNIISNVLLDQVKCTEVDVRTSGVINQLLDMGDVCLTFDRPTHQQEFVFQNIRQYNEVGSYLRDILVNPSDPKRMTPVWYSTLDEPEKIKFREEELFPGEVSSLI